MTTAKTVSYEKINCTRCGGSGHYSFNLKDGSVCYKCRGSGWQLTARGRAAAAYADELLEVRIEDVPEGGRFEYSDMFKGYRFCTATEAEGLDANGLRSFRVTSANGKDLGSAGEGVRVRMHPTGDIIDRINAYQNSLTKAGKPRKR